MTKQNKLQTLLHPIQLPGITVPGNLFLAPMAGYTDRAMRLGCIRHGADLTYSEMVSCEGIIRNNKKTCDLMDHGPEEPFFAIQIFTGDPTVAAESVPALVAEKPSFIDLNCGCPVPKVTKAGAGSALMQAPETIGKIVKALRIFLDDSGAGHIPVTVKLRSGWDASSITFLKAAESAQQAGAALIALHPRTRKQGYSGKADWKKITALKKACSVPVFGSGDLFSGNDIVAMLKETGCDGIMAARGAVGNPFIFKQAKELAAGKEYAPTLLEKLNEAVEQLDSAVEFLGEKRACKEMRKHLCSFTKGISGGAAFRNRIVKAETVMQYKDCFSELIEKATTPDNL